MITIALLTSVSTYLIKHPSEQKHVLPYHDTSKLKEIDIKNRTCYHFDDIIKIEDYDFNNILINEKPCGNILVCNNS